MKIITWNVNCRNKKISKLLRFAFSYEPDVLCMQEVPQKIIPTLQAIRPYRMAHCYDFSSHHANKSAYICTLTKILPENVCDIQYSHKQERSLWNLVLYEKIHRNHEEHKALLVTIPWNNKKICIVNTRLSCAVGTRDRLEQFDNITRHIPKDVIPLVCGDMNIPDSRIFQRLTGWIRGFTHWDYLLDERSEFEKLFAYNGLTNIFRGKSTYVLPRPRLQFDHILIPNSITVRTKEIPRKRFRSDHHMLFADIDV